MRAFPGSRYEAQDRLPSHESQYADRSLAGGSEIRANRCY
jgi:hypothetical protein